MNANAVGSLKIPDKYIHKFLDKTISIESIGYFQKGQDINDFINYRESFEKYNIDYPKYISKKEYKIEKLGKIDIFYYNMFMYKRLGVYYILAFENDKLLFWGLPEDFNKSPDPKLNKIGKAIKKDYDKLTEILINF